VSPASRDRKKKSSRGGTKRRGGRADALSVVPRAPGPSCPCPVCRGEGIDSEQLIDGLLGDVDGLVDAADPVEAEIAGAALVSMMTLAAAQSGLDELLTHVLVGRLIPTLERRANIEAMAVLLAVGSVTEGTVATAASAATDRLARAGVTRPRWADELAAPMRAQSCWRFCDPGGTESILGASFTRAGRSHALLLHVDALDCGAATAITLLAADEVPGALAILRAADSYDTGHTGGPVREDTLDAAQWRWQVENALDARAVHDDTDGYDITGFDADEFDADEFDADEFDADEFDPHDPDDEQPEPASYRAMALLLRARLATMPVSSKPKPPHGGHGQDPTAELAALAKVLDQLAGDPARAALCGPDPVTTLPSKRAKKDRPAPIFQLKVGIRGAKPPIWRRLELSADTSLAALHRIIQIAFGWDDYHLHVFRTPYGEFGAPDSDLGHRAEASVTVEQVAPAVGNKIAYTYDFGDDWNLDIAVEKLLPPDPTTRYPRCTGGRRAGPPEDSGGIWCYQNLIEARADPNHRDHDHALDWLGYTNPADFDPNAVTKALFHSP
jgi:hypothetical protein